MTLLFENVMHAVAAYRHRHAVRSVCAADRAPGGEPDGDRFPAAIEAQVASCVDVDREVGFDHPAVYIHAVAGGCLSEVDDVVWVFGIMAPQSLAEAADQIIAQYSRQLLWSPL